MYKKSSTDFWLTNCAKSASMCWCGNPPAEQAPELGDSHRVITVPTTAPQYGAPPAGEAPQSGDDPQGSHGARHSTLMWGCCQSELF